MVVHTFEPTDEILTCEHLNESYKPTRSSDNAYCIILYKILVFLTSELGDEIIMCGHSSESQGQFAVRLLMNVIEIQNIPAEKSSLACQLASNHLRYARLYRADTKTKRTNILYNIFYCQTCLTVFQESNK